MNSPLEGGRPGADAREIVVIVVNYRTPDLIGDCLASLSAERTAWPGLKAVVVDGGSDDGSPEAIERTIREMGAEDWVNLQPLPVNGGFGYANNQALLALEASGALPEAILLLNPDATLRPGALAPTLALLDGNPRIAAVGAQLEDEDGRPLKSAFDFPSAAESFLSAARTGLLRRLFRRPETPLSSPAPRRVDWATGAALLLRRAALAEVGLFNDHFFLYFEETELCHRFHRAGWEVWTQPEARARHLGARATGLFDPKSGRLVQRRLPRYWFVSWRRYFVLTHGRTYALRAALAWTLGHIVWRLRCLVTGRPVELPPRMAADFWRTGLGPARHRIAYPPRLGDAPGAPPGWMAVDGAAPSATPA